VTVPRRGAGSLWDYSFNWLAAKQARFARTERIADTPLAGLTWAYHFDASLYAAYLSRLAQGMGVHRVDGMIAEVLLQESGDVRALRLADGRELAADFFIDCTGFRGLLIEKALGIGYESWSHWLPCDRAWAVPSGRVRPLLPAYALELRAKAGWQWRIPLQHRTGNGYVYASSHTSDERARELLLANLDAPTLAEPRLIRFTTGRRQQLWNRNVVVHGGSPAASSSRSNPRPFT
jgi:tryptophan halogenase